MRQFLPILDPKAFEEAAERIAEGQNTLSCIALLMAVKHDIRENERFRLAFTEFFHPGDHGSVIWWRSSGLPGEEFSQQNCLDARVFALLLMAEMIRDEKQAKKSNDNHHRKTAKKQVGGKGRGK
jgi:hypothetical protein